MGSLTGKTAVVTGSTSGIGLAMARAFAAEGANIVLNGFGDAAEIERLRRELAAKHRVSVAYDGADMSRPESIWSMMAKGARRIRGGRPPRQQRRRPACRAGRRFSSGGLAGAAALGVLYDRYGWGACVAGIGAALIVAALLAARLQVTETTNERTAPLYGSAR